MFDPISGKVTTDYSPCVTLPMITLRGKEDAWGPTATESQFDDEAIATLRDLLAERVKLDALFTRTEDVEILIKMSGGVIRDLIQLVSSAATYTEDPAKITPEAVQQAVQDLRADYMRLMLTHPKDYLCLAKIAQRLPISTDERDFNAELNRLLFRGCLLEYVQDNLPWYDIHPVLVDTEEFRHARAHHG